MEEYVICVLFAYAASLTILYQSSIVDGVYLHSDIHVCGLDLRYC